MPMPLSFTRSSNAASASSASVSFSVMEIEPPSGVNLYAFDKRFRSTRFSRFLSKYA